MTQITATFGADSAPDDKNLVSAVSAEFFAGRLKVNKKTLGVTTDAALLTRMFSARARDINNLREREAKQQGNASYVAVDANDVAIACTGFGEPSIALTEQQVHTYALKAVKAKYGKNAPYISRDDAKAMYANALQSLADAIALDEGSNSHRFRVAWLPALLAPKPATEAIELEEVLANTNTN